MYVAAIGIERGRVILDSGEFVRDGMKSTWQCPLKYLAMWNEEARKAFHMAHTKATQLEGGQHEAMLMP
eukprot:6203045-Pleurochrysis_carterae.AAC.2